MIRRAYQNPAPRLARVAAVLVALAFSSCGQALLTAPNDSVMTIFVNPSFIAANGDTAVVSVHIIEPAGTLVPDGTVVQFFTTLGKIQEQAKTNDGVARVNLISDSRSGEAEISAFSGAVTSDAKGIVSIGAVRPTQILLSLIDPRIDLKTGKNTASFRVTVLDDKGNGVASVPVRFSVKDTALDTILDNGTIWTNNNGEAIGRVQTKRTTAGTITVTATMLSSDSKSDTLDISVIE